MNVFDRRVAGSVRVMPADVSFEAAQGETIMDAAERNGFRWPTTCHGLAECAVCVFHVMTGGDRLSPVGPAEEARLQTVKLSSLDPDRVFRLACQAQIVGDITIFKRGIRQKS